MSDGQITRRNLAMFVLPCRGNTMWQWNCAEIARRAHLFNGKRLVYVASDPRLNTATIDEVAERLRPLTPLMIPVANNRRLREATVFPDMLSRMRSTSPHEATFFCHAKGVTRTEDVRPWTSAMYAGLLDAWPRVDELLTHHAIVGAVLSHQVCRVLGYVPWHYPGTFYWFSHSATFDGRDLSAPQITHGAEAWPATVFSREEAGVLHPQPVGNLYVPDNVPEIAPSAAVPVGWRYSVIIPCHNYGSHLRQAVESVLNQTVQPAEIVIVDDGSTDDTLAVARSLAMDHPTSGIEVLTQPHSGAWAARRAGYQHVVRQVAVPEMADRHALLILDADDWIDPDYVGHGLRMFRRPEIGLVSTDLTCFGETTRVIRLPDTVTETSLARSLTGLHAGCLVRLSALALSRAFDVPPPHPLTHDDNWLWRQVLSHGYTTAKSCGVYHYRRHGRTKNIRAQGVSWYDRGGLAQAAVTIAIPLSGRHWAWPHTADWLQRQEWPRAQCRLLLLDTSQSRDFGRLVERTDLSEYPDIQRVRLDVGVQGLADLPRHAQRWPVQAAMCRIWRAVAGRVSSDWCLTLEDDHVPRPDVIDRLLHGITDASVDGVVSPYRSRWCDAWVVRREGEWATTPLSGVERITEGAGLGCMLIRSTCLQEHLWRPAEAGYDPLFGQSVHLLCDWETECLHLSPEGPR